MEQLRMRRRRAMNRENVIGLREIGFIKIVLGIMRSAYSGTAEHMDIVFVIAINGLTGIEGKLHPDTGDHLNREGYPGAGNQGKRMGVTGLGETATRVRHFDAIVKLLSIEVKMDPSGLRLAQEKVVALVKSRRSASCHP